MNKGAQNVVCLKSSRFNVCLGLVGFLFITGITAAMSAAFLSHAKKGSDDFWFSLEIGVGCLVIAGLSLAVCFNVQRKIRVPDVLEFSPNKFRYLSVVDHKDVSVPWSEISEPEIRTGSKGYYLYFEVAGVPQTFPAGYWAESSEAIIDRINPDISNIGGASGLGI